MPSKPKPSESQEDFMSRCVTAYKEEGETPEKAQEICSAMWNKGSTSKRSVDAVYKRLAQNQ